MAELHVTRGMYINSWNGDGRRAMCCFAGQSLASPLDDCAAKLGGVGHFITTTEGSLYM
jgi:hypothetical protein